MKVYVFFLSLFALGCTSGGSNSSGASFPLGTAMAGATLSGPLAGKQLYLIGAPVNPSGCWVDSEFWSGSELFFGITSLDYTSVNDGSLVYNGSCSPSPPFDPQSGPGVTGNFNIYRAEVVGSAWVLTILPINAGQTTSLAAPKLSGSLMVFVKYEKASGYGNIYLSTRTGDNTYTAPIAFSQNSATCDDDNPALSNSGNQIIFTSTRNIGNGSSCSPTNNKTFWSSTFSGGVWSTPVSITGAPAAATNAVDQAWVDSTGTNLYWTGVGTDCTSLSETCIITAGGGGTNWPNSPTQIASGMPVLSWPTTGGTFVSLIGQFTEGNGYAFTACGITYYVGSSVTSGLTTLNSQSVFAGANSPSPPYYYYHTDIKACVIPL
jgi:hypothetical protein